MRLTLGKSHFLLIFCMIVTLLYMSVRILKLSNSTFVMKAPLREVVKNLSYLNTKNSDLTNKVSDVNHSDVSNKNNEKSLKYILLWNSPKSVPFVYMGQGQSVFIEQNCEYKNCYVTSDREYLGDYTKFDVIAFNGPTISQLHENNLPKKRSRHQKYVFGSIESSDYYPVCTNRFDGFFNWTWTFKLDSDSRWGYLVVRDINGTIIGPKKEMHWKRLEDMDPVPQDLREKLKKKSKLAAWFVSNCVSRSQREVFVKQLNKKLEASGYQVDIYGQCGKKSCPRSNETMCDEMIDKDYFFYLSFENALSEDYVTEKLVRALQYNMIPVVYGAANYTRFMPDGIYLNARELGVEKLAAKMLDLMNDFEKYVEYFKWKNHYKYHRRNVAFDTNDYCGFCALLNNEEKVKETSIYEHFREWWDPPDRC